MSSVTTRTYCASKLLWDTSPFTRHYTLSAEGLAMINCRRRNQSRLGFALMIRYLQFPGCVFQEGAQPPAALCVFVPEQLGVNPVHLGNCAERDQTRRAHHIAIQATFEYHSCKRSLYRALSGRPLPTTITTEQGSALVATLLEELRVRHIICPPLPVVERLCGEVRVLAQQQLWRQLTDGLTDKNATRWISCSKFALGPVKYAGVVMANCLRGHNRQFL